MTYITRIANKRILAKYFLYSLQINYFHWKLSACRSIFSCYATIVNPNQYSFERLQRVIPWIIRFINNCHPHNKKCFINYLKTAALHQAEAHIF